FTSFRHRARSWPRQRRICYKAEHTSAGTNLRFVITNCAGCASQVFAFYNDRGECENRIEEFKNGFRADRLSCHRFLANAFRLLLHGAAYNLVNFFRPLSAAAVALSPDRNSARPVVQTRRSHTPDRPLRSLSPRHRLALSEPVPFRRARRQQQLTRFLTSEPDSPQAVSAEPCAKSPALCSRSSFVSHSPLRPLDSAIPRHPDHTFRSSDELSRLRICSSWFLPDYFCATCTVGRRTPWCCWCSHICSRSSIAEPTG